MDLNRQPPRRPSNTGMGGVVGLARMTDKARGHYAELIGEFKYGQISGNDADLLAFLNTTEEAFLDLAIATPDDELAEQVVASSGRSTAEIDEFNTQQLDREPEDDLHRRLLKERIEAYAPERTDIKTVLKSIELDDWGAFRNTDLTAAPPRTAYIKTVLGIVAAARMADKARASRIDKLGGYYLDGDDSYRDRQIRELLGIDAATFAEGAWLNPNDVELGEWLLERIKPLSTGTVSAFNARMSLHGIATPGYEERFAKRRDEVCGEGRNDITTYFELMDIDDQDHFEIVDLERRPPRSPYDASVAGILSFGRMIDKGRAHLAQRLSVYYFGEDSGFDRRILEHLGITQEQFEKGLSEHATDDAVLGWLQPQLEAVAGKVDDLNETLQSLSPDNVRDFLRGAVRKLDPARTDLDTFMAFSELDDVVTFARLHSHV
ncbi:MAG TPA: DUF5069 domain-containing protein [Candidatus Latescibacteria bacterium]|nr:DUF5069 domain-containing protein [Candidatus Latescibacterota bacterium]